MDYFIKAISITVIGLIAWIPISRQNKEMAIVLTIVTCSLVLIGTFGFLKPVLSFLDQLETIGKLDHQLVNVLLKAVGVGILTEIIGLLCKDVGNAAVGKSVQFLSSAVILWLSVPLLDELIELVDDMLGAL